MRLRQLSDLQLDVQKLADVENATTFMPLADITELVNQAWTRVYGTLCLSGETYFLTQASFTTSSGQPTYYTTAGSGPSGTNVLPLDLWNVKGVDVMTSGGYWRNAHRFEFERRNDYQVSNGGTWTWPARPLYDYQGMGDIASLTFIPTPSDSASTVRLWYFPACVRLVNPTDTIDGGNGWERWAIAIAARWVAMKDENYELVQALDQEIAKWEADSKAEIASRNVEEAPQMRRVRYKRNRTGWPYGPGDGGW